MFGREFRRVFDVLRGKNLAGEVRFDDVLKPRHFRMIEKAAARADVRIYMSRVRRVLPPVAQLITVGVQDRIESQRLNGALLSRFLGMVWPNTHGLPVKNLVRGIFGVELYRAPGRRRVIAAVQV